MFRRTYFSLGYIFFLRKLYTTLIINAKYSNNIVDTAIVLVLNSSLHNQINLSNKFIEHLLSPSTIPKFLFMTKFVIFLLVPLNAAKFHLTLDSEVLVSSSNRSNHSLHSRHTNNHR